MYEINRFKILVDTCFVQSIAMNILEFEITQTVRWLIYTVLLGPTHQKIQIILSTCSALLYLTEILPNKTLLHVPVTQKPATGIKICCALIFCFISSICFSQVTVNMNITFTFLTFAHYQWSLIHYTEWVTPEKIHTPLPPTDGKLEILAGGRGGGGLIA